MLSGVKEVKDIHGVFVGIALNIRGYPDKLTLDGQLNHNPGVELNVGGRTYPGGKLGDVVGAAHQLQLAVFPELGDHGAHVHRFRRLEEVGDGLVDFLMLFGVEVFGAEELDYCS